MGWTGYDTPDPRAALAEHLSDANVLAGPVWSFLPTARRPEGHAWALVTTWAEREEDRRPLVVLLLVDVQAHVGRPWTYIKDVDETMGPLRYDVPPEWLDRLPPPEGRFAEEWRAQARRYATLARL